jgi:hypothetical protein
MDVRVTGWKSDSYFSKMESVSTIDDGWRVIASCPICSQNWLVDEYDKVQNLYAIKIDDPNDASKLNFLAIHKKCLIEAHDGESTSKCLIAGCENKSVNDFVYCAECLIEKQGVYE